MIETHPFKFYCPPTPQVLIMGSFPCYNGTDYGLWFYRGSGKSFLWPILSEIFQMPANTLEEMKEISIAHNIAFADIALKIKRKKQNCLDSNLIILEYNIESIRYCLSRGVQQVFFTSKFVQKHFINLFPNYNGMAKPIPSPSPAANLHIAKQNDYHSLKAKGIISGVYEYRLWHYKKLFLEKENPKQGNNCS